MAGVKKDRCERHDQYCQMLHMESLVTLEKHSFLEKVWAKVRILLSLKSKTEDMTFFFKLNCEKNHVGITGKIKAKRNVFTVIYF